MGLQTNSTQQLKRIASTLGKMGKFFNEMAELCRLQLSKTDTLKEKDLCGVDRESIDSNKRPEKRKADGRLQSKMEMVKDLKPKHPVSSFFIFYRDRGQQIAKDNGETVGAKIAKIVGEIWNGMSEAEREPYETKAREGRAKYEEEMSVYRVKYCDEIAELKRHKREARDRMKREQEGPKKTSKPEGGRKGADGRGQRGEGSSDVGASSEEDSPLSVEDGLSDSLDIKSLSSLQSQASSAQCRPGWASLPPQQASAKIGEK